MLEQMKPQIIRHEAMQLIGIPCIGLDRMGEKFQLAKTSLLALARHLPQVKRPKVHYGVHPHSAAQDHPDTHVFILCVETESMADAPEWLFTTSLPAFSCVATANRDGDYDAAGAAGGGFLQAEGLRAGAGGWAYTIGERYSYEAEGYVHYSPPLLASKT